MHTPSTGVQRRAHSPCATAHLRLSCAGAGPSLKAMRRDPHGPTKLQGQARLQLQAPSCQGLWQRVSAGGSGAAAAAVPLLLALARPVQAAAMPQVSVALRLLLRKWGELARVLQQLRMPGARRAGAGAAVAAAREVEALVVLHRPILLTAHSMGSCQQANPCLGLRVQQGVGRMGRSPAAAAAACAARGRATRRIW